MEVKCINCNATITYDYTSMWNNGLIFYKQSNGKLVAIKVKNGIYCSNETNIQTLLDKGEIELIFLVIEGYR